MTLNVDLFFSFRSPYSYLATPRLLGLAEEYDLEFSVRPVLPLAVRDHTFFSRVNPLWPRYVLSRSRVPVARSASPSWRCRPSSLPAAGPTPTPSSTTPKRDVPPTTSRTSTG